MVEPDTLASPLSLLSEVDEAREVLALTYGFNAAFWERTALSIARRLGARVTVVADAAMAVVDPRAVRRAGVTYVDGRAIVDGGGAFHAKLFVIASHHEAIVAVGSGNLTLNGWHGNAEIWTILRGFEDRAPTAIGQVASFLEDLQSVVRFSDGVTQALERTALLLKRLPAHDPSPTVVSSTRHPIVDQLPIGPVDSLSVSSPFLDPRSEAVRRLVERFRPDRWEVVLDRDANFDGESLVALAESQAGTLHTISSKRFHHGKLVEWFLGGDAYALTGSPNASGSGLLRSAAQGGNIELGLIDRISTSLRPATSPIVPLDDYRLKEYVQETRTRPAVLLLGGYLKDDGLTLDLSRPLEVPATLEIAEEDIWLSSHTAPPATNPVVLPLFLRSGTLVRLRLDTGQFSNVIAATLLELPLRRSIPSIGRVQTNEADIFSDPGLAAEFARDLAQLKSVLQQPSGAKSNHSSEAGGDRTLSFETWEEYLEHISSHLGEAMTRYGLALPQLGASSEWLDTQHDPDDPDEARNDDHGTAERSLPDLRRAPRPFRVRYQRWATRLVAMLPELLPTAQLVGARLALRSIATGVWDDADQSYGLLLDMATALSMSESRFEEEIPSLAAMVALCLTLARLEIGLESTGSKEVAYAKAVEACRAVLAATDGETVERYAIELKADLGLAVEVHRVLDVARRLSNPLDQVVLDAEDLGLRLYRSGRTYHFRDWVHNPRDAAVRVVARGEKLSPIAVIYDMDGDCLLVGWNRPYLAFERRTGDGVVGELLRLGVLEPSDLRRRDPAEVRRLRTGTWMTELSRPPEVVRLLARLGLGRSPQSGPAQTS